MYFSVLWGDPQAELQQRGHGGGRVGGKSLYWGAETKQFRSLLGMSIFLNVIFSVSSVAFNWSFQLWRAMVDQRIIIIEQSELRVWCDFKRRWKSDARRNKKCNVNFQLIFPAAKSNGWPTERQRKVDSEEAFRSHEESRSPQPDLLPSGWWWTMQWRWSAFDLTCIHQAIPNTPFTLGVALPTQ